MFGGRCVRVHMRLCVKRMNEFSEQGAGTDLRCTNTAYKVACVFYIKITTPVRPRRYSVHSIWLSAYVVSHFDAVHTACGGVIMKVSECVGCYRE